MDVLHLHYTVVKRKTYIGQTNNLERRIEEHNTREGRYTSNKGPWKLIFKEEFASRSLAMRREKFLKSGKGREYIKKNLTKEQSGPPQADRL
jgi:putative endonuclease